MASDMERIKAALDAHGCHIQRCLGYSRCCDEFYHTSAVHTAILKLIRETREECAGVAKTNRERWENAYGSYESLAAAAKIEQDIQALNEEDKHGD